MAKKTVKAETKTVKQPERTSEELAFMLNQQYVQLIQAQNSINAINKELERRQSIKPKE